VLLHYKNKQKQTVPEMVPEKEEDGSEMETGATTGELLVTGAADGNGHGIATSSHVHTPTNPSFPANPSPITNGNDLISDTEISIEEEKKAANSSEDWPLRRLLYIYLVVIIIGMIAGMVGLGGGVLIAPLTMELGVHPQSAAATSTLVVLFSSTIASVTFGLYGRINLSYFAVYGPVCFVGGLVGVFVLSGLVRRYNMASIITLLLGVLVVLSAGLVAGFAMREGIEEVVDSGSVHAASAFC
jgi:hypothetical protein